MMRLVPWISSFALAGVVAFSARPAHRLAPAPVAEAELSSAGFSIARIAHPTLPAGTEIDVTLGTRLSSQGASRGDVWIGSVRRPVLVDGVIVVPAGSAASGMIMDAGSGREGEPAWLDVGLASVTIGDHTYPAHGTAAPSRGSRGRPVTLEAGFPLNFRLDEALVIRQP